MRKKLLEYIHSFVPKDDEANPAIYWRTRMLVYLHFFFLVAVIIMALITLFAMHANDNVPFIFGFVFLPFSLYLLKRYQNPTYSGNLIVLTWFAILVPAVFQTGGFYSDNLLWLLIAPVVAMLFAGKKSGFWWLGGVIGVCVVLFFLHLENDDLYKSQIENFTPDYYLTSYVLFAVVLLGVVWIFEYGQESTIKALEEQKNLLAKHQMHIKKQMDELRAAQRKIEETNKQLEQFA
ncbi:MAG: hypothetical protein D6694_10980, partial [Gammaproteobacteria bacterium]